MWLSPRGIIASLIHKILPKAAGDLKLITKTLGIWSITELE